MPIAVVNRRSFSNSTAAAVESEVQTASFGMAAISPSGPAIYLRASAEVAGMVASGLGPTTSGSGDPPPTNLGSNLAAYLDEPGGQLLVLADGDYTCSDFDGTGVRAGGGTWQANTLILKAQTPGGVHIVPSNPATVAGHRPIWTDLERVIFVGFVFENVVLNINGCKNVKFWYCEHFYPSVEHPAPADGSGAPCGAVLTSSGSVRGDGVGWYGSHIHDVGDDGIRAKSQDNLEFIGGRMLDIDRKDARFAFHQDGFQFLGGVGALVTDSELGPDNGGHFQIQSNTGIVGTTSTTVTVNDTWVYDSINYGFILGHELTDPGTMTLNRTNVYSWGHNATATPNDVIDSYNNATVNDTNVTTSEPPGFPAAPPYVAWQAANQYPSYKSYFEILW